MKEAFVIVQAIPHEEIRDSFCQNEARVKRVGKALIPICSRSSVATRHSVTLLPVRLGSTLAVLQSNADSARINSRHPDRPDHPTQAFWAVIMTCANFNLPHKL